MIVYGILGGAFVLTVAVWWKMHGVLRLFHTNIQTGYEDIDSLPSVSLCIPARNETHAMTACLESALLSRYPKLEIIVLDDGSRDNTGHLIKSFAHSGVRFVEGSPLPNGWLGKNHALADLFKEASGTLVLFADVDTRFTPNSIGSMVTYMLKEKVDMVSVLPFRQNTMRASAILATFRHFWNIVGHTSRRPAAASNAWLVKRDVLRDSFHGLDDLAKSVRPEKVVAQSLSIQSLYRFIISDQALGVSYEKKLSSQYETSVRVYYPDFGVLGTIVRTLGLLLALAPYLTVIVGLITGHFVLALAAFCVTIATSLLNAWYLGVLKSNNYGIASICLPFLLAREVILLLASVVLYKTGTVSWKGRPVSLE